MTLVTLTTNQKKGLTKDFPRDPPQLFGVDNAFLVDQKLTDFDGLQNCNEKQRKQTATSRKPVEFVWAFVVTGVKNASQKQVYRKEMY